MALKLVTGPTTEPVSLTEAKLHLRLDIDDDDTLVTALIQTAREEAEQLTRRALITQTWDLVMDDWPASDGITLPLGQLQSVTGVYYTDDNAVTYTLSSSLYLVDTYSEPGRLRLKSGETWPSDSLAAVNGVRVRFVAGYTSASMVPAPIRQAMLLRIGDLYENREDTIAGAGQSVQRLPNGMMNLLWPWRILEF